MVVSLATEEGELPLKSFQCHLPPDLTGYTIETITSTVGKTIEPIDFSQDGGSIRGMEEDH